MIDCLLRAKGAKFKLPPCSPSDRHAFLNFRRDVRQAQASAPVSAAGFHPPPPAAAPSRPVAFGAPHPVY